jgi:hypothetical protein
MRSADLLDAPSALAACCGFDLCHKYILYLYLYLYWVTSGPSTRVRVFSLTVSSEGTLLRFQRRQ